MKHKKIVMYLLGIFTGGGVAIAVVSNANDSVIPYTFQDGQVISADTLNDLFTSINNATKGYVSESELNGSWSCQTYDPAPVGARTSGMPNMNFQIDSVTGLLKLSNTWTFSSNGTSLSMNLTPIGGVAANNTGACSGTSTFTYSAKVVESTLMLTPTTGCLGGTGSTLQINKISPYKFRAFLSPGVISCVAVNQPPAIPTDLSASASSSGVRLTWTDNGGSATGFSVLKKINGVYTEIGTSSTNSYTDSSGALGSLYRIKSTNANGSSLASIAAIAN
jgi:hypothetical protein